MRYDGNKYGATSGNQYAARHCSILTRLTRYSLTRVRVHYGAAIFAHYILYNNYIILHTKVLSIKLNRV